MSNDPPKADRVKEIICLKKLLKRPSHAMSIISQYSIVNCHLFQLRVASFGEGVAGRRILENRCGFFN